MTFHFVLVRDRISKVVPEADFDAILALEADGWNVVWDSARSEFDGHGRAACFHRTVPDSWIDDMHPKPIVEPVTLFRSVSPGELESILTTEALSGRGNSFNEFDKRRFVFFGDVLDAHLIWQGEDVERQAIVAVHEREQVQGTFDMLLERRISLIESLKAEATPHLDRLNRRLRAGGHPERAFEQGMFENWKRGSGGPSVYRLGLPFDPPELEAICAEIRKANVDIDAFVGRYRTMVQEKTREMRSLIADAPYTSAILEFAPMSHGLRYARTDDEGVDHEVEYGFFPNSVHLSDVVAVHWVVDRVVVERTGPDVIEERVEAMREHCNREGDAGPRVR